MSVPTIEVEVQLAGWKISHTDGAKITFWLPDESALEPFRTLTARAGSKSGQRLMAVFVLIDDEEQPVAVEKPKGASRFPSGMTGLAVRWCQDERFHDWLAGHFPAEWHTASAELANTWQERCAIVVKMICGIGSRRELDTNERARETFDLLIRDPYRAHLREIGP